MNNPFVYGEIVPLEAFVGRVIELDRLATDLASGQKVFLISPRRYGKSSLVRQAFAALARKRKSSRSSSRSAASARTSRSSRATRARWWGSNRRPRGRGRGCAICSPASRPEVRSIAGAGGGGADAGRFRPSARRATPARLAEEVFALPGADRRAAQPAARRSRSTSSRPIDRLQRRLGRAGAARRRAAAAAGRLRLRGLRADADGTDDRPETAVLQSRSGDAAAADPGRRLRGVRRRRASASPA